MRGLRKLITQGEGNALQQWGDEFPAAFEQLLPQSSPVQSRPQLLTAVVAEFRAGLPHREPAWPLYTGAGDDLQLVERRRTAERRGSGRARNHFTRVECSCSTKSCLHLAKR